MTKTPRSKALWALLLTSTTLAPIQSAWSQDDDEDEPTDVLTVTGRAEFFRPLEATSSTKIPLPINETPQAITVLTADILDAVAARDLEDTIGLVPGLVNIGTNAGLDNRFSSRGFNISVANGIFINNVVAATNIDRDLLGVERVEFLRGPSSIVLGTLNFGGAINIVTRRPSDTVEYGFRIEGGDFDRYRVQGEVSGPLNESGSVRGYLGMAYEDRGSFRDGEELQKVPVKAALDIDLSSNTVLEIDASYEEGDGTPTGLFSRLYGQDDPQPELIPIDWNPCGFVDGCFTEYTNIDLVSNLRHEINDNLDARLTIGYGNTDRNHSYISFLGLGGPQAFGVIPSSANAPGIYGFWYTYNDSDTYETFFTEVALNGEFEAFGSDENKFLLLGEYRNRQYEEDYQLQDPSTFFNQYANVLTPTTDSPLVNDTTLSIQETFSWDTQDREEVNFAFTAQAILNPIEPLQVLLGLRYENEDLSLTGLNSAQPIPGPNGTEGLFNQVDDIILRAGLVYELVEDVNAYFSYSEGFLPSESINEVENVIFDPETGTQYEIGLKGEFFGGLLGAGVAAFFIERDNVGVVIDPGPNAFADTRAQEHKGVELEVVGEVAPGLDLIATYSYLETEVTESPDNASQLGLEVQNAPNHLASLFAQYQIPSLGGIEGISLGGGFRYVGEQEADDSNSVQIEPYTLFEANVTWQIDENYTLQFSGDNLSDERYYVSPFGTGFAGWTYGAPRSYLVTLTANF